MRYRGVLVDSHYNDPHPDAFGTAVVNAPVMAVAETLESIRGWATVMLAKEQFKDARCDIYIIEERLIESHTGIPARA